MQYRPDTRAQCFQIITGRAFIDIQTQNITECLRIMTGLPQGPGKSWTQLCSGNSPNGPMTRPGPGPTSEKLTSDLALVHGGGPWPGLSPGAPLLPGQIRAELCHWCINTKIRSSDYILQPFKTPTIIIKLKELEMFKANMEHLVNSISSRFQLSLTHPEPSIIRIRLLQCKHLAFLVD